MLKKLVLFVVVIAAASFLFGYIYTQNRNRSDVSENNTVVKEPVQTAEPVKPSEPPKEVIDPVKEEIKEMSLEEKIGQMVLVGFDGYELNDNTAQMIEKYHVGGFILFKNNIKDTTQMVALLNSLKSGNSVNKVPLFLSVDEEGGRVSRMPDEMVKVPPMKVVGQTNNSTFSYELGNAIGEEIKSFGFNMDFAPVLDINSNPNNPVIGDRAFGSDSDVVSRLGVQTMKGIQSSNVISVVKHFPGHGDTSVDSHIGLPVVDNDLKRLESFELIPFKEAIKNNADAVMVAHILLPKIDPDNPASFSKAIITDILRNSLKFDGVVITDDMTMGAIAKNYNMGTAAVKSINAGGDIVLVCHGFENETSVINALTNAAKSGRISEQRINESVYRILKLKQKYSLKDEPASQADVRKINNNISAVLSKYLK